MGEIIRVLSKTILLGKEVEIELNYPTRVGNEEIVHIQSKQFRFEFKKNEFIQICLSILLAEKNFKELKKIL